MTHPATARTVKAPGATLYYEVRGSGPLLLMIPGGPADAGVFAPLAEAMADRYTVVAYDPRGNSRSTFDGDPVDQDLAVHADDAALVIEAAGGGPAYVLGSSGGAQIGLALAVRHPDSVKTLVAHEPPALTMLPEAEAKAAMAGMDEVYDAYRLGGVEPAMAAFARLTGLRPPADGPPPPPEVMAAFGRIGGNMDYFLGHSRALAFGVPDVESLRKGKPRIVIGVGAESKGQLAHRTAEALAEKLGAPPVVFPGDHGGGDDHNPKPFAEVLDRALRGA